MKVGALPGYLQPNAAFQTRKAAQACAFFALKDEKGIDKLKLIKLIYLAERTHLADRHWPMVWDDLYSLPHGPVGSSTLNGIDGKIHQDVWAAYICRHGNKTFAVRKFCRDELDELSNAEVKTLEKVWQMYGAMSASRLRNYTHEACPEYTETDGPRVPIGYGELLRAVGLPDEEAMEVTNEIASWRKAEAVLHS